MPAQYEANPLPYMLRELTGKLRLIRPVSPLTYAFEEGQAVALGQQPRAAEAFGLECHQRTSRVFVVLVDRKGARSEQCTEAATGAALNHDDAAACAERAECLFLHRDALLGPHVRHQHLLDVTTDSVEVRVL